MCLSAFMVRGLVGSSQDLVSVMVKVRVKARLRVPQSRLYWRHTISYKKINELIVILNLRDKLFRVALTLALFSRARKHL